MNKWIERTILGMPGSMKERFRAKLRKKALSRTHSRLVLSGVDIDSLSDDELEIIIRDEEDKLIDEYKSRGIIALLALLGISWF